MFSGYPYPWTIERLSSITRFLQLKMPSVLNASAADKNTTTIILATRSHFHPRLYSHATLKFPMRLSSRLGSVSRSAVSLLISLYDAATGELLYEDEKVVINVDLTSFRAVPINEEVAEEFKKYCHRKTVPRITSPQKPKDGGSFQCQRQAVSSDIDHLNHVNAHSYLKFCLDAASLARKEDPTETENAFLLKSADCVHKAEVKEGDTMDIFMWKSEKPNVVHFQIEVEAKAVCNMTLEFYNQDVASKL
jgi:acyl-CoA thioesterase FadM